MIYRNDMPSVTIPAGLFQKFDRGNEVDIWVDEEYDLQPGERFGWVCAQFDGVAEIIARKDGECCTIIKR